MKKHSENSKMIGTDEAMRILNIGSRNTLKKMVDCGIIKNYQFWRRDNWRFNREELERLMERETKVND